MADTGFVRTGLTALRRICRPRRGGVGVVVATTCLLLPLTALAHTMPPLTASTVAKQVVAQVKSETHAASGRVVSCARKSNHRFLCKGEEKYRSGASRCTFDIVVRYTSATKRTTAHDILNYRCF